MIRQAPHRRSRIEARIEQRQGGDKGQGRLPVQPGGGEVTAVRVMAVADKMETVREHR